MPPAAPAVEAAAGGRGSRVRCSSCLSRWGGRCGGAGTSGHREGVGGESLGAAPLKEVWRAAQYAGGSVAEWSKALDLGSSHFDGVGSNPTAAKLFCPRGGGSFSPPNQCGHRGSERGWPRGGGWPGRARRPAAAWGGARGSLVTVPKIEL